MRRHRRIRLPARLLIRPGSRQQMVSATQALHHHSRKRRNGCPQPQFVSVHGDQAGLRQGPLECPLHRFAVRAQLRTQRHNGGPPERPARKRRALRPRPRRAQARRPHQGRHRRQTNPERRRQAGGRCRLTVPPQDQHISQPAHPVHADHPASDPGGRGRSGSCHGTGRLGRCHSSGPQPPQKQGCLKRSVLIRLTDGVLFRSHPNPPSDF